MVGILRLGDLVAHSSQELGPFIEPGIELQMQDHGDIESAFRHMPPYPYSECSLATLKAGPVIGTSPKGDCELYLQSESKAVLQPPTSCLWTTPAHHPPLLNVLQSKWQFMGCILRED